MARVLADNEDLAVASDDFALVAHFLDRRTYLHIIFLSVMRIVLYFTPSRRRLISYIFFLLSIWRPKRFLSAEKDPSLFGEAPRCRRVSHMACANNGTLLEAVRDASAIQVIDRQLNRDLVTRQDLDVMHTHLAGNMGQDLVPVLKLDLEHRVGQRLEDGTFKLDYVFFSQNCSSKQTLSQNSNRRC